MNKQETKEKELIELRQLVDEAEREHMLINGATLALYCGMDTIERFLPFLRSQSVQVETELNALSHAIYMLSEKLSPFDGKSKELAKKLAILESEEE